MAVITCISGIHSAGSCLFEKDLVQIVYYDSI